MVNVTTLVVGDVVGVVCNQGYSQGLYEVIKTTKTRVTVSRIGDSYIRTFVASKNIEDTSFYKKHPGWSPYIVSQEQIFESEKKKLIENQIHALWGTVQECAKSRDLENLEIALEALKNAKAVKESA